MTVTLQIVGLRQRKSRDSSSFANRLWQQAKFFSPDTLDPVSI